MLYVAVPTAPANSVRWRSRVRLALLLLVLWIGSTLLDNRGASTQPEEETIQCRSIPATLRRADGTDGTPAPSAHVLLYDDFSDAAASRLQLAADADARYGLSRKAYFIAASKPLLLSWSLINQSYQDVSIQVDTRLSNGPSSTASGLIFRYQNDRNYYLFNVACNGFYNLELLKDDIPVVLIDWTPSEAIRQLAAQAAAGPGQPRPRAARNTLRVELQDEHITLFVNGVKLEETIDDTFSRGRVGLALNTFDEGGAMMCFDNLMIAANDRASRAQNNVAH